MKAIMGPHVIDDHYTVNDSRIYIAGFADGGKVANQVQAADPVTFQGGIYMCWSHALGGRGAWQDR